MVVGAFPAIKLAVLLFKQISKPLANFAKERAKNNRFFRTYVCMPPAQFYNWCEVKSKMWIMNLGKPVTVPVLNEQMAIELGANLLGEGIIFILGAAVLIVEYNRSSKKEAAKEEDRLNEMRKLVDTVNELYFSVQTQDTQIRELQRTIGDLEGRVVVKPWTHKKDTDSEQPPPPPPTVPPLIVTKDTIINTSKINAPDKTDPVPFPQKSIVMESLNYVELDVLNTPQVENKQNNSNLIYERSPSFLTDALMYIKTDLRGLL